MSYVVSSRNEAEKAARNTPYVDTGSPRIFAFFLSALHVPDFFSFTSNYFDEACRHPRLVHVDVFKPVTFGVQRLQLEAQLVLLFTAAGVQAFSYATTTLNRARDVSPVLH